MINDFCLIFVPFGHYDETEILPYAITLICPIGAAVRHFPLVDLRVDFDPQLLVQLRFLWEVYQPMIDYFLTRSTDPDNVAPIG